MSEHFDSLYQRCYEDLHRLAAGVLRGNQRLEVSPTTLVHEAWLRLRRAPELADTSPAHFKAIAARAMRQILVDEARRRYAQRRGGPAHFTLSLDEGQLGAPCSLELILDLDDALQALRASGDQGERMEAAVVYRWLGGCTVAEVADVLGISTSAVERDWRATQAWLKNRLGALQP